MTRFGRRDRRPKDAGSLEACDHAIDSEKNPPVVIRPSTPTYKYFEHQFGRAACPEAPFPLPSSYGMDLLIKSAELLQIPKVGDRCLNFQLNWLVAVS